jgi:hypothetical protein
VSISDIKKEIMATKSELRKSCIKRLNRDDNFKKLFPNLELENLDSSTLEKIANSNSNYSEWIDILGPKPRYRTVYQKAYSLYPLGEFGIAPKDLDYQTAIELVEGNDPLKILKAYELSTLQKGLLISLHAENFSGSPRRIRGYTARSGNPKTIKGPTQRKESGVGYKAYRGTGGGES